MNGHHRGRWAAAPILASTVLLAGCGGTPAAVESPSDSGSAAFFGTKGVEATFTNKTVVPAYVYTIRNWELEVKDRDSGQTWKVPQGASKTFRGERNISDDLELTLSGPARASKLTIDLDFSNPSMGCPNVTVSVPAQDKSTNEAFCSEGETEKFVRASSAGQWDITIKREDDNDDFKRFSLEVHWDPQPWRDGIT